VSEKTTTRKRALVLCVPVDSGPPLEPERTHAVTFCEGCRAPIWVHDSTLEYFAEHREASATFLCTACGQKVNQLRPGIPTEVNPAWSAEDQRAVMDRIKGLS
jgi:hypothetical protein